MTRTGKDHTIPLMRPYMPERDEFDRYLDRIWESRQLTNHGPIHKEFEKALKKHLGVRNISLFTNGTLALVMALKALDLKGKIITTPFTSPATLQAIYWNHLQPVFVDINPVDLNLDPRLIEAAIDPETSAILPVHLFGNPCDVTAIGEIAKRHHLRTIYDAAHCFGVKINGIPLCRFGDLSMLSLHATKVINCIEGGVIISHDPILKQAIDSLTIFSHENAQDSSFYGLNVKMNEIQAAFGIVQLKQIKKVIGMRKNATRIYQDLLSGIRGIRYITPGKGVEHNYTYFPVIINPVEFGTGRDDLAAALEKKGITTRKYFFPLACDLHAYESGGNHHFPVASDTSENILCLPLYHDIEREKITYIVKAIRQTIGKRS